MAYEVWFRMHSIPGRKRFGKKQTTGKHPMIQFGDRSFTTSELQKSSKSVDRGGLTIVELVGCLCVAGLLATLLPAAVLSAREDARRQQCQTNLKILGMAMHNYHSGFGVFPMGWVEPQAQISTAPLRGDSLGGYGWQVMILPYMDNLHIYNRINFKIPLPKPAVADLQETIAGLHCPSDRTEVTNSMRDNYGTSNYSGCSGWTLVPEWGPGEVSQYWPGTIPIPQEINGVFWRNKCASFNSVVDGASGTIFLGEKSLTSGGGIWPGVRSNQLKGDQVTSCRYGHEINSGLDSFSSPHEGGAFFLMGDGRVHFLNEKIQSLDGEQENQVGIFQRLSSYNGGEPAKITFD